jgi:hypothetical protein
MSEYLGNIEIPEITPSGTFPITSDYGYGMSEDPQVAIHQFGSANAKIEQRFLLGTGAKRFTVHKAAMSEAQRAALRNFWEAEYGAYGAFTYNAPNDDGIGTTPYTVHIANEPLSWEFLLDSLSTTGVTLVEIPATDPTYTLNSTVTRFPSSGLKTALLSQVQEIIPLIKIQPRETGYPAIYVSDRRCTIDTQLYLARMLEFDGISQSIGNESDQAQFTFGNADRVMTALVNDTNLNRASLEFSLFHVGTGIKVDLWKGEIVNWAGSEGAEFQVTAADGIYELTLPYPTRQISRTCWKCFDDGNGCPFTAQSTGMDMTHFPTADDGVCDKSYDGPNGCIAHGMKRYFGGVIAVPQSVMLKDNSSGTLGFGRTAINSTSIVSDSVYDQFVPEVYTEALSYTDPNGYVTTGMRVNCKIAAGRAEIDFYEAIGIVSEGPIEINTHGPTKVSSTQLGTPYEIPTLDSQYDHMYPGLLGRLVAGNDPAGATEFFSLDANGDKTAGNWRLIYSGGQTYDDNFAAGTSFLTIRRKDTGSLSLTTPSEHAMVVNVLNGISGWVWTAANTRTWQVLGNPIWIIVNMLLRALGLRFASAATAEGYFDVDAAIVAAGICEESVVRLIGTGDEKQFVFNGALQEQKPLRDWIQEVLNNCLGYFTFSFGKLKLGIRENSSAVEAFTVGNIIFQSLQLSPLKPAFNHLTANFGDLEYNFAANSVTVYDIDHAKLIGGATAPLFLKSSISLSGTCTKSQAARIISTRMREELGGVGADQWKAGRLLSYKTTVLALNTESGMVCSMTHPDMPAGAIDGDPTPNYGEFRITGWKLNKDYSIEVQGQTTTDEMYDLTIGPKPADVLVSAVPVETIIAGPSGASDLEVYTHADDDTIPLGAYVAQCAGETTYQETIKGEAYWLSPALPSQGPYSTQRTAFPSASLESGTCTVQGGTKRISCTRTAAPTMVDKVLCIYVPGDDPDAQLSGQIITAEGTDYLEVDPAFVFSGSFSYVIIQPWWDKTVSIDVGYKWVPKEQFIPITSTLHKTPPLDAPAGTYYLTRASMNQYGLGTLLTVGPFTIVAAGGGVGDSAIPGEAGSLVGTGAGGIFHVDWTLPTTGGLQTLDQFALQYSVNSDHSSPVATIILGKDQHYEFIGPNKTYYFQVAAHNMSGIASDAGSVSLGATGWGPWKTYPVAASSGDFTGAPPPAALPGSVNSFAVWVQNGNDFVATWEPPSTGGPFDDYLLEYSPVAAFTNDGTLISVPLGTVLSIDGKEWGRTYYFRISAHNLSGITSGGGSGDARQSYWHSSGWGPWTNYGSPTAVTSDPMPTGKLDSTGQSGISRANTGLTSLGDVARTLPDNKVPSSVTTGISDAHAAGDTAYDYADTAYSRAGTALTNAATADGKAVTADGKAVTADGKAVTADGKAVTAQGTANTATDLANTAQGSADTAQTAADTAWDHAEDGIAYTGIVEGETATAQGRADDAYDYADSAYSRASTALDTANNVDSSIGSIDSELSNHESRIQYLEDQ